MAIDISKVFRTNVKAIRMSLSADGKATSDILNEEILGQKKAKTPKTTTAAPSHVKEAANILSNITLLKNFLNENKEFYIQPNYLLAGGDSTNQIDFQNFEDQAESIISKCANAIRNLKSAASAQSFSQQFSEHLDSVFYPLEKYFREVCKVYSEQKAIRVKRLVERKNQSQLCSKEVEFLPIDNNSSKGKNNDHILNEEIEKEQAERIKKLEKTFTEQELLSLEKENETLYEHLSMQSEEVKKIESQVIEVSRLTEIFTENITSQLTTVNSIQKSTVETNSNLTIGNESIKEAMRKNAALRLWILFIIIVLSFTLLFLDWYND